MCAIVEGLTYEAIPRWVYKELWGKEAEWRHVRALVENGIMEVDGPPPDGRKELVGDVTDLEGHRSALDLDRIFVP